MRHALLTLNLPVVLVAIMRERTPRRLLYECFVYLSRAILKDHKEDGFKCRERSHSPIAHVIPQRSSKTRFSEIAVSDREPHHCSSHRKWIDSAEKPGRLAALGRQAGRFGALHCTAIPTASFSLRLMLPTPIKMTSRID